MCMCVQGQANADFYVKEQAPMEFVILFLSQFPPKNTHSLGISGQRFGVILCLSMKSWRNAIITLPNRHFSEMRVNNWEHERGKWKEG